MLENYLDQMNVNLVDMLDYVAAIDPNYDENLDKCFTIKQLKLKIYDRYDHYLHCGISHLYEINDYEKMEKELVMMNYFFGKDQEFIEVKKAMKKLVMNLRNPISIYRLLRHIMNLSKRTLIAELYSKNYITLENAAYFSLVENEVDDAYEYLNMMEEKVQGPILSLYASYDLVGAIKLETKSYRHYSNEFVYA